MTFRGGLQKLIPKVTRIELVHIIDKKSSLIDQFSRLLERVFKNRPKRPYRTYRYGFGMIAT